MMECIMMISMYVLHEPLAEELGPALLSEVVGLENIVQLRLHLGAVLTSLADLPLDVDAEGNVQDLFVEPSRITFRKCDDVLNESRTSIMLSS